METRCRMLGISSAMPVLSMNSRETPMRNRQARKTREKGKLPPHAAVALGPPHGGEHPCTEDREGADLDVQGAVEALADERPEGHRDQGGERCDHRRPHAGDMAQGLHRERIEVPEDEADADEDGHEPSHEEP